ncbi:hypothetical protein ACTFSP_09625 [Bacillus cereus group sp. MYBK108-2]|uniref:hypothetical protein n=1 Tax=unclassified Bacillus cereus group TaxID=2750818 RepID=UPI003F793390
MKRYIIIISVWLMTIGLIILNFITPPSKSWVNFWTNGTIILGWILLAIQTTYNNLDIFFMFVKRMKFQIQNPDCVWNMRMYMMTNASGNLLDELDLKLAQIYTADQLKIRQISMVRRDYKLGAIRFEVNYNEDKKEFIFDIQDMEVSYRGSKRIFDDKLDILINDLRRVFQPYNERYHVGIEFKELNPYFGLFLKKLDSKNIDGFNVSFHMKDSQINVYKKQIEISSGNYENLKSTAKSYLALSPN